MHSEATTLLHDALGAMQKQRPELCRDWFDALAPESLDGGVLRVTAPDADKERYLNSRCAEAFNNAAQTVSGRLITVRFCVQGAAAARPSAITTAAMQPVREDDELPFHPDYTFDTFVVGPSSRLAHAAATAAAEQPGQAYNPLFIHGGVGLGKSHLLQAVCHRIRSENPAAKILYISCEGFTTRYIDAVQAGDMTAFRHRFRDVDTLVIDDIHFLARRNRTQDEFFHTFNTLYQAKRQIVLSSDEAPEMIPDLEDRLVSRFQWGLVAPIEPPDYETRIAILKRKAQLRGAALPDDVAALIAERVNSNIRELEGALTRIQMQAHIGRGVINLDVARQAMGIKDQKTAAAQAPTTSIEEIVRAVTEHYGVTLSALQSKKRQRSIALPRQVCMYLARRLTTYSLEEVGGSFGGRDHTTVLYAVRTITKQMAENEGFRAVVESLEAAIRK